MSIKENELNGSNGNVGTKNNVDSKSARFTVRHRVSKAPLMMHDLSECTGSDDCVHEQGVSMNGKEQKGVAPAQSIKASVSRQKKSVSSQSIKNTAKVHKRSATVQSNKTSAKAQKTVPMLNVETSEDEQNTVQAVKTSVKSEVNTTPLEGIKTNVKEQVTTSAVPSETKSFVGLKLVQKITNTKNKLFTGGIVASLVVAIIAGSTFGVGKMLPANTDLFQWVNGMATDVHADQLDKQGKTNDAILEFEKAIQQSPNDVSAYKKLAYIYEMDTRDMGKATKVLKDAILVTDSDPDLWRLLAYAQYWNGENLDAAKSIQKSLDLRRDDSLSTSTLALIVAAGGDLARGKDLIQQAMNNDSSNGGVYFNASLMYRLYAKDTNKAEELIRHAIKLEPNNSTFWWELSNVLAVENKKDDVEQALRQAKNFQPDNASRVKDLAEYLTYSESKNAEGADLFRQAVSMGLDDASTLRDLAGALFNAGKYAEAAVEAQKTVDLQPNNADYVLLLGRSQYLALNYTAARDAFTQLVNLDQGNATNWNWLGLAYYQAGDYAKAIANFNKALQVDNRDANIWTNLADATDKSGDLYNAADYALNALSINPNSDFAWDIVDRVGNDMIKNNQSNLAKQLFTQATAYQSTSAERGKVVGDLGQFS